jgi:ABC-type Na+ efflux pump permease subunit
MLRTIAGVIVGYIVMAICVVAALSVLFIVMGEDWAFQEGTYRTSMGWALSMLAAGFVAAFIGGLVCRLIAGGRKKATIALAVVVVLLGGLDAAMRLSQPERTEAELARTEDTPVTEAAGLAQSPKWMGLANPIVGVAGVLLAGTIGRKKVGNSAGTDS